MKNVPIAVENIDFIRLDLSRHYIQIDCDFVCYIVLNPSGSIPVGGTDVCLFHIGAWQVDAWKFLTKDFAEIPGFSACLVWDKTLVTDRAKAPQVAESDIDTANSISSLKGQPVNITGFSLASGESLKVSTLDSESCNVQPLKTFGEADIKFFPVSSFFKCFEVGDTLDSSVFSEIPKNFYKIVSDDTIRLFAPYFMCQYSNDTKWVACNRGNGGLGSFSSPNYGYGDCKFGKVYVDLGIVNDIIDSIKFTGYCTSFHRAANQSDSDNISTTLWASLLELDCSYVSFGI